MSARTARGASAIAIALSPFLACAPDADDRVSIVTAPKVLAVQMTPADALPGAAFTLDALYVGPQGALDPSSFDWAVCRRPKPLGQPGPVDPGCLAASSPDLAPLASGAVASGAVPADACRLFGPDSPTPLPGQPSARPTDPDPTGGFYVPVRGLARPGEAGPAPSVAAERVMCDPSGVTQAVFAQFRASYHANQNPNVDALVALDTHGAATTIAADEPGASVAPFVVAQGARVAFRASWPSCADDQPCAGAEPYVAVDATTHQVVPRREAVSLAWYATAGAFDDERSGRDEGDPATDVANAWTAPAVRLPGDAGLVHLWLVLRDSRGGAGWRSYTFIVR